MSMIQKLKNLFVFPKYKISQLNDGRHVALIKKTPFGWSALDKHGTSSWTKDAHIDAWCVVYDEEAAVDLIAQDIKRRKPRQLIKQALENANS